jgi:hypothetical protein
MALNERDTGGAQGNAERDPRLERLYREVAREGPPAHLDAAVLAAARREVGARPRSLSSALRRWHVPVSIAAVVVASVSLVILVKEEGGERFGEARVPPIVAPADPPAAAPTQAPLAAVAKATAQRRAEARAPAEQRGLREDANRPVLVGESTGKAERDSDPVTTSGAGAPATPEPAAKPPAERLLTAPPRLAQERAASASEDTVTAGRLEGGAPSPVELRSSAPTADALSAKPMAQATAAKPAARDRPPIWHGFEKQPPEKWLERIEELMREGRVTEAEVMRSEFKRRFPDHPRPQGSK